MTDLQFIFRSYNSSFTIVQRVILENELESRARSTVFTIDFDSEMFCGDRSGISCSSILHRTTFHQGTDQ